MVEAKTHCSTHYPAHPWWCNWQECQLIFFQCFEIPFGCQEHSLLARSSRFGSQQWRKLFWRFSKAAKKEAEACGWEQNCPPRSWWPPSPVLDVWQQAHQKWSCNPAWSKPFGTSYLALQECRPCKPAGQKMVQNQCWHRLKAVGGKRFWGCDLAMGNAWTYWLNTFTTYCFKKWEIHAWCEFSTHCFQDIISAWFALHCNDWKKRWHLQHYGHQGKPGQPKTVWSRCQLVLKVEPWLSQQTCKGKLKPSKQVLCQCTNKQVVPSASFWSNMVLPNTTKHWHQLACWCIPAIELVPCWATTMLGSRENKCSLSKFCSGGSKGATTRLIHLISPVKICISVVVPNCWYVFVQKAARQYI